MISTTPTSWVFYFSTFNISQFPLGSLFSVQFDWMYQKVSTSPLTHYYSPITTLTLMALMIKMKLALTKSLMIIVLLFYDSFLAFLVAPFDD